jgi:hypothetical protein
VEKWSVNPKLHPMVIGPAFRNLSIFGHIACCDSTKWLLKMKTKLRYLEWQE